MELHLELEETYLPTVGTCTNLRYIADCFSTAVVVGDIVEITPEGGKLWLGFAECFRRSYAFIRVYLF